MAQNKEKYTVISPTNKILYVGSARDISVKYSVDRNTVYQASYGKMLLKGKYKVRLATEEEAKLNYPKYFVAKPNGRPKLLIPTEPLVTDMAEKQKVEFEERPKVHIPQKYRSSSGHRFSKL